MKGSIPLAALVVITEGPWPTRRCRPRLARGGRDLRTVASCRRPALRFLRRILPLTEDYDGRRLLTSAGKRRMFTPLVIVIAAIGVANVEFALDSIPAIFGLTSDAYIIFTANALALMALRQLYFLIGGLLEKVVYLKIGIVTSLLFIVATLAITTVLSLMKSSRDACSAAQAE